MADVAKELKRANDLKEEELTLLKNVASSQAMVAGVALAKSREGNWWQKFWYGGDGGAGRRSAHMRISH